MLYPLSFSFSFSLFLSLSHTRSQYIISLSFSLKHVYSFSVVRMCRFSRLSRIGVVVIVDMCARRRFDVSYGVCIHATAGNNIHSRSRTMPIFFVFDRNSEYEHERLVYMNQEFKVSKYIVYYPLCDTQINIIVYGLELQF